jgi:hypothetical protein
VRSPGNCTSIPNRAFPEIFSGESSRRVGLPISFQCFLSFSFTERGGVCACAATASCPYESFSLPRKTNPFSVRSLPGSVFHCAAAARTSMARAIAPAVR